MAIDIREPLPIKASNHAEIVTFKLASSNKEHVAWVFPRPRDIQDDTPTLVRIHSKCLTGDTFQSLRCDCGPQLQEAIERMSTVGGVILYMDDEGRGIGLYEKIKAYVLQRTKGLDTFEANKALGHQDDLRDYRPAVEMLKDLGIERVWLLSNNPEKAKGLQRGGIVVEAVVPTGKYESEFNTNYLRAKAMHGHIIDMEPLPEPRSYIKLVK